MTYLVVGGGGFLGSYFIDELKKSDHNIIATAQNIEGLQDDAALTWKRCNVTNREEVDTLLGEMVEPYRVLYLAACHNPDVVQKNPQMAWDINITALSYFLNRANRADSFYYPSTDTVYGEGTETYAFKEEDALQPLNTYGKQKVLAEHLVTTYGHHVVRYPFLIGTSLSPRKKHFYDVIYETVAKGKPIEMFADSYRSTLSFRQAAELTLKLTELKQENVPQILNVAADAALSKYDVGLKIAKKYGLDPKLVVPITIQKAQGIFEAPRATTTLIDNKKLKEVLGLSAIYLCLD
jgi:dTDP-4-dehydrorhamnose reductase